ncbi:MAG: hypothetical protein ACTSUT_14090 [Promethearchaeota archaeon]
MAILEKDLSRDVLEILVKEYKIIKEFPLYNRCIDAVLLKNGIIYTIEFKINDWHRAIKQIRTHMLIADFAYLCMPNKNFPVELRELLKNYGIGLWAYDSHKKELQEVLPPIHSFIQQLTLKRKILQYLVKGEEDVYSKALYKIR